MEWELISERHVFSKLHKESKLLECYALVDVCRHTQED